jgi:hypothetical protein
VVQSPDTITGRARAGCIRHRTGDRGIPDGELFPCVIAGQARSDLLISLQRPIEIGQVPVDVMGDPHRCHSL